ncbi:MAG: CHAP domain-containing protein [Myxococcaceae bacterium]|nr:CHAP domain-containing protein [Myxococcaceae bacterium]
MRWASLFVVSFAVGCATGRPAGAFTGPQAQTYRRVTPAAAPRPLPPPEPSRLPALTGSRDEVLARARALVGKQRLSLDGRDYPATCDGLVLAAYAPTGLSLSAAARSGDNAVTALYRLAQARGRLFRDEAPAPGDLAFFRDTYDLNRDGRSNDGLTHVGIVESVDGDGTVAVIHHVSRGVARYHMNPAHPTVRVDPRTGKVLNHALRAGAGGRTPSLTGELFVTYASLLPAAAVAGR